MKKIILSLVFLCATAAHAATAVPEFISKGSKYILEFNSIVIEATIEEISQSEEWIKVLDNRGNTFWINVSQIVFVRDVE